MIFGPEILVGAHVGEMDDVPPVTNMRRAV